MRSTTRFKFLALLIFGVNATMSGAFAGGGITLGYVTGNTYLTLDDNSRMGWLIGAMDGIMAEDISVKSPPNGTWLGNCLDGLSKEQIKAIFEKELQTKPETWHTPAAFIFRNQLFKFCAARK